MARLKWNFRKYVRFLESYSFSCGHIRGSHHYYNGKINGKERVVQAIFSKKEKECQSNKTILMGVRNSGIPRKYFEDWDKNGTVHKDIIF